MKGKKIITLSLAGILSSLALAGCNNSKVAKEIMDKLVIDSAYKNPEAGFSIPTLVKHNGNDYTITWSENSDYVEIGNWDEKTKRVNITRPSKGSASADYELVATIEADGKKASKSFKGSIVAYQENPIVYTDAAKLTKDLITDEGENDTVKKGTNVEFVGVVARIDNAGTYIQDEKGEIFFVYGKNDSIKVGDKVKATGPLDIYHSLCQFGKGTTLEGLSRGNSYQPLKTYSKESLTAGELWDLDVKAGDPIHFTKFKLTGMLDKVENGKNEDYVIKDLVNPSKYHKLYYATDKDYYAEYTKSIGKKVTYDVAFYSHHKDGYSYVMYDGEDKTNLPAGVPLTAKETLIQDAAEFTVPNTIAANLEKTYEVKVNDKEKRIYNLEYNAVMDNPQDANPIAKDGTVTIPQGTVKVKELTVKLTNSTDSSLTTERKFQNLVVGIDKFTSINEVMSKKDNNYYFMKVDVVWANYEHMLVHETGKPEKLHYMVVDDKPRATGKTITVRGKYNLSNGNDRIKVTKGDLIGEPVNDETPYVFDYSKAVDFDFQAFEAVVKAGVEIKDIENNETLKPFHELYKNNTIVKYETYVTKFVNSQNKENKSIKFPTTAINEDFTAKTEFKTIDGQDGNIKSELNKDTYKYGDKVVVYAILKQYKPDGTKVKSVCAYMLKIEKVSA